VQIKDIGDWNADGFVVHIYAAFRRFRGCTAVSLAL
jgi:hypothetical protein